MHEGSSELSHNGSIKHGIWSHLLAWANLISFVTDLSGLARSWSSPAALWWFWWSLRCSLEAPVDSFPRSAGPLCLRMSYTRLNFDFWACLDSNTDRVPAGLRLFRNTWWTCTRCTRWTRSRTTATDLKARKDLPAARIRSGASTMMVSKCLLLVFSLSAFSKFLLFFLICCILRAWQELRLSTDCSMRKWQFIYTKSDVQSSVSVVPKVMYICKLLNIYI